MAIVGFLSGILGVLLGGGIQIYIAHRNRVAASRTAARLLFADLHTGASAVRSLRDLHFWWSDELKPPLEDWRKYREPLAAFMWGPDFQTVDGVFKRIEHLERCRAAGLKGEEMADDAEEAARQAYEAGGVLLRHGFNKREYEAASREMEAWETEHGAFQMEDAAEEGHPAMSIEGKLA